MRPFYLGNPNSSGVFVVDLKRDQFVDGVSLYRFEPFKDDEKKAHFSLHNAPGVYQRITENWDEVLWVCECDDYPEKRIESIETVKKGVAELRPSGHWRMVQKAKIKFTESETPSWYKPKKPASSPEGDQPPEVDEEGTGSAAPIKAVSSDEVPAKDVSSKKAVASAKGASDGEADFEPNRPGRGPAHKGSGKSKQPTLGGSSEAARIRAGYDKVAAGAASVGSPAPSTSQPSQGIAGGAVDTGGSKKKTSSCATCAVVLAVIAALTGLSLIIYYNYLRDHTKVAVAHNKKALSYLEAKNFSAAASHFNKAIKHSPAEAKFYDNRGGMYLIMGNYDSAVSDYGKAIKRSPQNVDYYVHRAQALHAKKDYPNAVSDYTEAIKLSPRDTFFIVRGRLLSEMSKPDDALGNYTQAIVFNPKNAAFYGGRGNIYYDKKLFAKALSDYNDAISRGLKDAECYAKRGQILFDGRKYSDAVNDFSQALSLNYTDAVWLYTVRGDAYLAQNNHSAAEGDYSKAIELGSNAERLAKRGLARYHQKKFKEAIDDFEEALRLNPGEPTAKKWLPESKSGLWMEEFIKGLNSP